MQDLEKFIKECPTCQQTIPPQREPLLPTPLPDYPWEKLATDLFHHNGINYNYIASRLLLSVCGSSEIVNHYFSRCHILFESNVRSSWDSHDIIK